MMHNSHTTTPNQNTVEQDIQKLVNAHSNLYWKTHHEMMNFRNDGLPKTCLEDSATERNKQYVRRLEKIVEELLTFGAALRVVRKTNGPVTTELTDPQCECANPIENKKYKQLTSKLTSKAKEVLGSTGMANGSQNPPIRMLNRMKVLLQSTRNLKKKELKNTTPEDTNIDDMPAIIALQADITLLQGWVTELEQEKQNTDQSRLCNNTDRIAMIKRLSGNTKESDDKPAIVAETPLYELMSESEQNNYEGMEWALDEI